MEGIGKKAVEVKQVSKRYDEKTVLNNVSFAVRAGTIHGFIGPNGAGKTTTIKSLMGGIIPSSGEIYITKKKRGEDENVNRKIGYMFEKLEFSNNLTVEDFIYLAGKERNIPFQKVESRLQKSDLRNFRTKKCSELSTG
jgi:ABC-2 type transport system ATP-binding protein